MEFSLLKPVLDEEVLQVPSPDKKGFPLPRQGARQKQEEQNE
jgi:hypothetical protein